MKIQGRGKLLSVERSGKTLWRGPAPGTSEVFSRFLSWDE